MIELAKTKYTEVSKLLELQKKAFKNDYEKYQDHDTNPYCESEQTLKDSIDNDEFYTIYLNENIIGGIVLKVIHNERVHLYKLFIDPKIQGVGYGSEAVKLVYKIYSKVPLWTVYTPHGNILNHKFYEKMGFVKYGEAEINDNLRLFKYKKR
ncbi:GNAT family N-acetyltransferase [Macrococcus sp. EM39E]|uniref:GNAT family N-acetyltransferase n=1 Tax=Macrococcus animalis TaxID=3395467 RepID=UPI0039BF0D58